MRILGVLFIAFPLAMLGSYALTPWVPNKPEPATIFGLVLAAIGYLILTLSFMYKKDE
jgi:hypothetical protein